MLLISGGQSSSENFQKPIIIGKSSYNYMKSTVDISGKLDEKIFLISFIYQHRLDKKVPDISKFYLSFMGCKKNLNLELFNSNTGEFLKRCNLAKNTNLIFQNNWIENIFNLNVVNPSFGTGSLNAKYEPDDLKLDMNFDFQGIPNIDGYKSITTDISLKNMSLYFDIQSKSGKGLRGNAYIYGEKFHTIINDAEKVFDRKDLPEQAEFYLRKFPDFYKRYFNNIRESYFYFGGISVQNEQILKTELVSLYDELGPNLFRGFKVKGNGKYRGRGVVNMLPILDRNIINNEIDINRNSDQIKFSISDNGGLMSVDTNTGIPIYLEYNFGISIRDQQVGNFKLVMNTDFYSNDKDKRISFEEAKKECTSIGLKIGTEIFGNCVMNLID